MPRGPRGERRPADAIGAAIMVARLATGEITEINNQKSGRTRSGARARQKAFAAGAQQNRQEGGCGAVGLSHAEE